MDKPIQEQFGEQVIAAFADFARADLKSVDDLSNDEFRHITDHELRRAIAQVYYGARWIYKLGLALLTRDEERAAHIRAQIVDYASICEALLSYSVAHALEKGHAKGDSYKWKDPNTKKQPLSWSSSNTQTLLRRQSLWWLVRVANEFGILSRELADDLQWLRQERNTVHIRERVSLGAQAYLNQSKKAFELTWKTILAARTWHGTHR